MVNRILAFFGGAVIGFVVALIVIIVVQDLIELGGI